jgi:hypothetical protein
MFIFLTNTKFYYVRKIENVNVGYFNQYIIN